MRSFLSRNFWCFKAEPFYLTANQTEVQLGVLLRQTRILVGVLAEVDAFCLHWELGWMGPECTKYGSYLTRRLRPLTLCLCGDKQPDTVMEEHLTQGWKNQKHPCVCASHSPWSSHWTCTCFIPLSEMQLIVTPTSWFGSEEQMKLYMLCIQHDGTTVKMCSFHSEYMPGTTLDHYTDTTFYFRTTVWDHTTVPILHIWKLRPRDAFLCILPTARWSRTDSHLGYLTWEHMFICWTGSRCSY